MRTVLDNLANKAKSGEEADLKSLESLQGQYVLSELYICYNANTEDLEARVMSQTEMESSQKDE